MDDFPPTNDAMLDPNGLLAIGGDLTPGRLIAAYAKGIFPWYDASQPVLWWSPHPRMVLLPHHFHCSRSLKKSIRRGQFRLASNRDFSAVIRACSEPRADAQGTWISPAMMAAYETLHQLGVAHSIEVYQAESLVGGLYGISLSKVFFGESMFSSVPDSSKIAFAAVGRLLNLGQLSLVDCQINNPHLQRMGCTEIARSDFEKRLHSGIREDRDWITCAVANPTPDVAQHSAPAWLADIPENPTILLEL